MRIAENFAAGVGKDFNVNGDFFRIETGAANIDVDFYRGGQIIAENLRSAAAGYWCAPQGGFDRVVITSSILQLVAVDVYKGRVGADRVAGSVAVSNFPAVSGAFVNTAATVTNADGQIAAANAARRYLSIKNKSATARVWFKFGAAAATAVNGWLLEPGEEKEFSGGYAPTDSVRAIGDAASNPDVVIIEG